MAKNSEMPAKVQQIHDTLQMLLIAISHLPISDGHPIYGVICLLIDQAQEVANKLSDPAYAGDDARFEKHAGGSKEDV
ncbi:MULTISPECIES: hypothetical protein [unclassified Caballeronia]|uniref:hypothetical protein n=1 Tax=unclassified Caballeronia TaxID=2646786 RepID=UPI002860A343|nr:MULTISPECIES: hypothetical protein [unclassified Caballeronia]MDR5777733.1 hypothetical protein [Caballeronia sp. LZ002]MDR5800575.1 hypothetical protein [Caballeronia sp. LZ001]MDR5802516.1 hypothetical protein [Caballeronia sp. LZ001]MDR5853163.1 hypothetical protein [Caballeronia sp. LZ003]